jgi:hypothetical protein
VGADRRERQLLELLTLWSAGDRRRAAGLAMEHSMEFPADAGRLADLSAWFGEARQLAGPGP